jgi:DNA-binding response OmpR family regulator
LFDCIARENPALLILDFDLPGLDGYSLQVELSNNEATQHLPVIILTALPASKTLFEQFKQVAFFLNKPFDIDDLLIKIKDILK